MNVTKVLKRKAEWSEGGGETESGSASKILVEAFSSSLALYPSLFPFLLSISFSSKQ